MSNVCSVVSSKEHVEVIALAKLEQVYEFVESIHHKLAFCSSLTIHYPAIKSGFKLACACV